MMIYLIIIIIIIINLDYYSLVNHLKLIINFHKNFIYLKLVFESFHFCFIYREFIIIIKWIKVVKYMLILVFQFPF